MKKLDSKGFAITSILYGLLIIFALMVGSYLIVLSTKKRSLDNIMKAMEGDTSVVIPEQEEPIVSLPEGGECWDYFSRYSSCPSTQELISRGEGHYDECFQFNYFYDCNYTFRLHIVMPTGEDFYDTCVVNIPQLYAFGTNQLIRYNINHAKELTISGVNITGLGSHVICGSLVIIDEPQYIPDEVEVISIAIGG